MVRWLAVLEGRCERGKTVKMRRAIVAGGTVTNDILGAVANFTLRV